MGDVQRRRLSEAARKLANRADCKLRIALDYGDGSREASARAIQERFGDKPLLEGFKTIELPSRNDSAFVRRFVMKSSSQYRTTEGSIC